MEIGSGQLNERIHHEQTMSINVLLEPRTSSAPFYFVLGRTPRLKASKLVVLSRLMRIVPHHGLAFFTMFHEEGLVDNCTKNEMRREQTRRHLHADTVARVYETNVNAVAASRADAFTK